MVLFLFSSSGGHTVPRSLAQPLSGPQALSCILIHSAHACAGAGLRGCAAGPAPGSRRSRSGRRPRGPSARLPHKPASPGTAPPERAVRQHRGRGVGGRERAWGGGEEDPEGSPRQPRHRARGPGRRLPARREGCPLEALAARPPAAEDSQVLKHSRTPSAAPRGRTPAAPAPRRAAGAPRRPSPALLRRRVVGGDAKPGDPLPPHPRPPGHARLQPGAPQGRWGAGARQPTFCGGVPMSISR